MQSGVHLMTVEAGPAIAATGITLVEPHLGIIDLCRMIEGLLPEPPARQPLAISGLDSLLLAADGDPREGEPRALLQPVRHCLMQGRRYFHWKQIPLIFWVEGTLEGTAGGTPGLDALALVAGGRRIELGFLLGSQLKPMLPGQTGWWWSPQLG